MKSNPFLKFFLFVALLLAVFCTMFWRELSEKAADTTVNVIGDQVDSGTPLSGNLDSITGSRLDLERNDIHKVSVQNLQVGARNGRDVDVSFLLINKGGSNEFPALRVHLLDARRKALRQIEVMPEEYSHTDVFTTGRIQLHVVLRENEVSFTVEPFYKIESHK